MRVLIYIFMLTICSSRIYFDLILCVYVFLLGTSWQSLGSGGKHLLFLVMSCPFPVVTGSIIDHNDAMSAAVVAWSRAPGLTGGRGQEPQETHGSRNKTAPKGNGIILDDIGLYWIMNQKMCVCVSCVVGFFLFLGWMFRGIGGEEFVCN